MFVCPSLARAYVPLDHRLLLSILCLPESRGETAGRNAILVDHLVRSIQRRHRGVDLRLEALPGHRVAILCKAKIETDQKGDLFQ